VSNKGWLLIVRDEIKRLILRLIDEDCSPTVTFYLRDLYENPPDTDYVTLEVQNLLASLVHFDMSVLDQRADLQDAAIHRLTQAVRYINRSIEQSDRP
jgi:hypothetical protein